MAKLNSELIKAKREEMGLSIEEAAEKLDFTVEMLTGLEDGTGQPVQAEITALMEFYDVSEGELILEDEEQEEAEETGEEEESAVGSS